MRKIKLYTTITLFFICLNIQAKRKFTVNDLSIKISDTTIVSKELLINSYKKIGYKLIYNKIHKYKSLNNTFFIFEHIINKTNFKQNRILVVTKVLGLNKYQVLNKIDNIIYDTNYTMSCYYGNNKESFNKISTFGFYITIEQNSCTKTQGETVHEYFTFKFDLIKKTYYLNKYSIEIEITNHVNNEIVKDWFPVETLFEKDFGIINISNFSRKELDRYIVKFPKNVYEKLK